MMATAAIVAVLVAKVAAVTVLLLLTSAKSRKIQKIFMREHRIRLPAFRTVVRVCMHVNVFIFDTCDCVHTVSQIARTNI